MKAASSRSADFTNVLQTLIKSVKLLQEATESTNLPLPSGPLAGVAIDRLETIKSLKANKDVGEELAEKIVHQVATIYHELARPVSSESDSPRITRASVTRYTKALTDAHDTLIRLSQRGLLGKSLLRGRDRRELLRMMLAVDTEFTAFMESLGREQNPSRGNRRSLHITPAAMQDFGVSGFSGRPTSPNMSQSHEDLHYHGQPQQHTYCWPGTRIPILDEIDHWATTTSTGHATNSSGPSTTSSSSLIYWLADISGSGKSAIAASLTEEWREKGILGGYYDFGTSNVIHIPTCVVGEDTGGGVDAGVLVPDPDAGDIPDALCEAWATQLGATFPELSSPILRALSDLHRSPAASSRSFSNQLKHLILNTLKTLQRARYDLQPHTKILFVLDSIEECPPPQRTAILQALKAVNAAHGGVKFFLISGLPTRDEDSDIAAELLEAPPSLVTRGSINIHSASNMADILLYLTSQFQVHAAQFHNHSQFRTALIEPTIRVLAKRAEGVILWAKLAFEMLVLAENPTRMLLNLVEEDALSDIRGLYLELVLTAQTSLDALNAQKAGLSPNEDQAEEVPPVSKRTEAFPKNALAMVLSATGYSAEFLSVTAIAELTGLGIDRTVTILDLLSTVIDHAHPAQSTSQPHVPLASSSSRVNVAGGYGNSNGMPGSPSNPRKRTQSTPRKSSFSPPRKKSNRPVSAHSGGLPYQHQQGVPHSPMSGSFHSGSGGSARIPSLDNVNLYRQESGPTSIQGTLLNPSSAATKTATHLPSASRFGHGGGEETALDGRVVRIRHATFREWIRLPHPPTLLSCLTGKGTAEEDDLRFVIAPSREGAHAMLARRCFGVMRGTTATPEEVAGHAMEGTVDHHHQHGQAEAGGRLSGSKDGADEVVSYACRYWAHHCAELLVSLTAMHERSAIYMSVSSGGTGSRWRAVRGDMLEFFTRKLLWWVDTCIALDGALQGARGLKALETVLKGMTPEEDLKSTVDQLTQWMQESARLLGDPNGLPKGEKGDTESSLVYKYYGEELSQRAKAQAAQSLPPLPIEMEAPLPPLPVSDSEVDSRKRGASSSRSAPSEKSTSIGKPETISTQDGSQRSGENVAARDITALPPIGVTLPTKDPAPQIQTPGSATPTAHPVVSVETMTAQTARTGAPPLMQPSRRDRADSKTASPPLRNMPGPPTTSALFPGLQFFQQNRSQQSLSSPVSPLSEQQAAAAVRGPQRKNSNPASYSPVTTAPKRPIPPPPPLPPVVTAVAPTSSSARRLSTGEVSPSSLTDILNMINFDSPSPGSTGATRGTGV